MKFTFYPLVNVITLSGFQRTIASHIVPNKTDDKKIVVKLLRKIDSFSKQFFSTAIPVQPTNLQSCSFVLVFFFLFFKSF
jgi:hypothetical protein